MPIEIVDLSSKQRDLLVAHEGDWRSESYQRDLAALWGFSENDPRITSAGVIVEREDLILYDRRSFHIEVSIAPTPRGLWVTGLSWMTATCGHGHAPSIRSDYAFKSYDDAKRATIQKAQFDLLQITRNETLSQSERQGAERAITHLDQYLTPQLSFFDHFQCGR